MVQADDDAVVVTGVGQHQMWAAQYLFLNQPKLLRDLRRDWESMGFELPAALGAQLGRPGATVWSVAGDGGFQMTLQELITAVEEKLPIKIRAVQQRVPGHGAPMAGDVLRRPLERGADARAGLRQTGQCVRHPGASRGAPGGRGQRRCRRPRHTTVHSSSSSWWSAKPTCIRWYPPEGHSAIPWRTHAPCSRPTRSTSATHLPTTCR